MQAPETVVASVVPMTPLPYSITRKRRENVGSWTLELQPVGEAIEQIQPGQFTMLYSFGVGEVPISTSGDTTKGESLVHTIRAAGAVTRRICALGLGDLVGVRGPFGNTWPLDEARGRDLVLVAGGVGLAPVRPALYHVLAHRSDYERVVLLVGGRSPDDLLFRNELERWRSRFDLSVDVTVDVADPAYRGRVGVVTKLIPRAPYDPDTAVAFVCGPEAMMWYAAKALVESGIPREQVFVSLERTMRCGIGLCGHCQLGPTLVCRDGPVYTWSQVERLLAVEEL
ncbi:MAG: FAD/NAD(P)-binding protein [Actinomycetota bacterium]